MRIAWLLLLSLTVAGTALSYGFGQASSRSFGKIGATPAPQRGPLSGSFQIAVMPDTQHYLSSGESSLYLDDQVNWVLTNRVAEGIAFVTHLGDVVNLSTQWGVGDRGPDRSAAMALLDGVLPYNVNQGNHDADDTTGAADNECPCTSFLAVFDATRYTGIPMAGFGGQHSGRPSFWQTFEANGITWLIFALEYKHATGAHGTYAWAQGIIDANPGLPVIVTTHASLQWGGRSTAHGVPLWDGLVKLNPEIVMTINGHFLEPIPGTVTSEYHQSSTNDAGFPVVEILANYQERTFGGDTWFQLVEFDFAANLVNVRTYNPKADTFETQSMSQYSVPLPLFPRLTQCNNGIDDDGDGLIDAAADSGCTGFGDNSELP